MKTIHSMRNASLSKFLNHKKKKIEAKLRNDLYMNEDTEKILNRSTYLFAAL